MDNSRRHPLHFKIIYQADRTQAELIKIEKMILGNKVKRLIIFKIN